MSIIVGLTGNIGSGKSMISEIFSALKIPDFYADEVAKDLLDSGQFMPELINSFGQKIMDAHHKVDKQKLASIVFNDKDLLQHLNTIIHPEVYKRFLDWVKENKSAPYVVMEAAILFESGFNKYVDLSINVHATIELRLQRVIARDKTNKDAVLKRMQNQLTDDEKIKLADYTIDNNGKKLVLSQVLEIHAQIKNKKDSK